MAEKLVATQSIRINAPLAEVWKALTDPEMIKKYFFGTETITDWKVGSPIFYRGEWEGKMYEDKGTVLAFEKEKLIKYNYWSSMSGIPDIPENYNDITYTVRKEGGAVVLDVKQEGLRDEATRVHSEENWALVMGGMKKLLEEKK
jgi:uncharacterized protein YndB with AHSA1/START domain